MTSRILGTTDVALQLGCSTERVRQLEREGKLYAEKTPNGRRVFKSEDVTQLAEERAKAKVEKAAKAA
jgi:DNA-binding transcriptional MerR regulator